MKKNTLQLQITGIVGLILIITCLLLTANSLFSAHNYYGNYADLIEEGMIELDPVLPETMSPSPISPEIIYQTASLKFSVQSVLVMVFIVLIALVLTYWATGKMLKPLEELTNSVQIIDDQNLDKRVKLSNASGEVYVLAESFNKMLDRLENSFHIQKRFASNAAHELKTPLAIIKSSLQVLEMNPQPKTADYKEFMYDTSKSLDRIIKTVESLLSLSNLSVITVDQNVDLYALLKQGVKELSCLAKENQINLSLTKGTDTLIRGNANLLYRAFYNLIENAIKYNQPGGNVFVALIEEKTYVTVQISDSGIGIEQEELNRIFEPFYRVDQSRSQKISGSGLGLSVVKMILEKHHGEIAVNSEVGKGTILSIQLDKLKEEKT